MMRLTLCLSRLAGLMALLGLAGVPVLAHADGRRPDEASGVVARGIRPVGAPAVQVAQETATAKMRGRMSPEERRRLREDVSDAGRSFYPPERPRGPQMGKGGQGLP